MSKLILVLRESYFWCKTMTWLVEDGLEEATGAHLSRSDPLRS
ncbi:MULTISPECIES: hypothetical protein [Lactiplantibacillus]|uniref:Uncharacterized protein n=2 Tax=Lactiplantibacillus plantarum TaxID=1590 RepID=A0AAW3RF72_LACPN|nr:MULTISPECIES: hypothetical protein [Lactiplantibacillus]ERO41920.1 hypothetical protein LPLWJ_10060 [Lactiplantibacillus plantarum WJL]ETF12758.1 hypothetical protein N654_0798 [Lactiplantibacillus plantarum 4_3]KPN43454.1 hypothetical protein WJL_0527 [Lactiplantibacillus plantarum WJL]KPN86569.1 hypothetical protein Nizo2877_0427 [Lactiplantibacillus plantarum]KZE00375.1 hypothetical protein FBR5_0029 [Lactiplantibacillus plantarum]